MADPGLFSRTGFRLMAWWMTFTRKGPALEERLRQSGVREGQTVLDYACGPGYHTIPAARLVGPAGRVYALDIQPAAARMVTKRAKTAGVDNVSVIVSDRDTGIPTGSVDLVLLYDAIAAIADKRGVLAELDRVLKPGGVLVLQGYTPKQLEYGTGGPPFVSHLYTPGLLREAFAGMDILELREYEADVAEGSGHCGRSALIGLVARRS